jgi:hypothetical protein
VERRNYKDPKYIKWRKAVYARDRWTCKMPGCPGTEKKLNAHHIKRWSSFPSLRFVVSNGITLCRACHERIKGLEENYESVFSRIVNKPKTDVALRLMMMRYGRRKEVHEEE